MIFNRRIAAALVACSAFVSLAAAAQSDKSAATGNIKGKVRAERDASNVAVVVQKDGQEIARTETNRKGEFELGGLAPGFYTLTFRKAGLGVKNLGKVEVRAGKTHKLDDVVLPPDLGSLVFIRGSVFDKDGHIVRGAHVELFRIEGGKEKRVDERYSSGDGEFNFRLPNVTTRYRVSARVEGHAAVSKEVSVEGPARYSVALTIQ